ncbi:MAG: DEAD/DEAH box helicase family protein [Zetaproteobacteria bacterium]|nr:DEAD/DEAH box helicase family protein [Zetaproteobacteria bacterium]
MASKPILSGAVYLPLNGTDKRTLKKILKDLKVGVYNVGNGETDYVNAWTEDRSGYVGVPRQYGLTLLGDTSCVDEVALGFELNKYDPIDLRGYQEPWVEELVSLLQKGQLDTIGMAATGKGKTVMALEAARRLGATTLIVVDQNSLRVQWVERIEQFLGIPQDQVGIIQGPKCDYEGRDFAVAMIQTLYSRAYPPEFYEYFGTVIFDESHVAGAPQFSQVLMQFPAEFRFGISATPDRTDALQKVIEYNLGGVGVTLKDKHKKSVVRVIEHKNPFSWYSNKSRMAGRYISEIASDGSRNLLLAKAIEWLYDNDRSVLGVSDRIEQLSDLKALLVALGIPEEEIGIIAGCRMVWGYAKELKPKRRPNGYVKDTEYTPVSLQLLKKKISEADMERNKIECSILLATYGMFNKGVDVPRLDAGIELTPRAKAQQVHGRILRPLDNKKIPIWVTVRDVNSYRAENQFYQRIGEYQKSNAKVKLWSVGQGLKTVKAAKLKKEVKQRVELLKAGRITTKSDGNFTVKT